MQPSIYKYVGYARISYTMHTSYERLHKSLYFLNSSFQSLYSRLAFRTKICNCARISNYIPSTLVVGRFVAVQFDESIYNPIHLHIDLTS